MKKMNLYTQDSMNPFVLVYYVNVSEDISTFEDFSFIFELHKYVETYSLILLSFAPLKTET